MTGQVRVAACPERHADCQSDLQADLDMLEELDPVGHGLASQPFSEAHAEQELNSHVPESAYGIGISHYSHGYGLMAR
jgi:endonuclease/exonuclease/phosphatase family metal-dependent hydrolase